ncbi:MAG: saccharopine dehydrogenase NADP-binding domain-containing protein [Myxococcota bacterium]
MTATKSYDVVLWGATGFTGTLVANHLASHAPSSLRWAVAGRSRSKLEALVAALVPKAGVRKPSLIVADSFDHSSLRRMAQQTRVICSTVGPYSRFGTSLVEVCVQEGVHYCDLAAEVPWMRQNIDRFHEICQDKGIRIVHSCGFDSIPSDLGVLMMHYEVQARFGQPLGRVRTRISKLRGGLSGGTIASILVMLEAYGDRSQRRVLRDPYALYPRGVQSGHDGADSLLPFQDPRRAQWNGMFLMAGVNSRVVRRSNALLGFPYGVGLRYNEALATGAGFLGWARALGIGTSFAALGLLGMTRAGRWGLRRIAAKPGEGPSKEQRQSGAFRLDLYADTDHVVPRHLHGWVEGHGDPGYGETAKMLAESALCLACDPPTGAAGVLTPASAMGLLLIERLRSHGIVFGVDRMDTPGLAPAA